MIFGVGAIDLAKKIIHRCLVMNTYRVLVKPITITNGKNEELSSNWYFA